MTFDYYYKQQVDQFSFIRVPKLLITSYRFKSLDTNTKFLYGLLLDKMGQSRFNNWVDDYNRAYIVYPIKEIQDDLNVSKSTAIACLQKLEDFGLVEKKTVRAGLPTVLYVKNFVVEEK